MTTITISGMSCAHCTGSVATLLGSIPGISDITVTLDPGQATFTAGPEVDMDQVRAAIRKIGFDPES